MRTAILTISPSISIIRIGLLILIISLLVSYIFQVNFLTRDVYLIKSQEKKIKTLSQENESLKIDFSKMGSLSNLENYLAVNQNFEKANQVRYIQILAGQVVTK